MNTSYLALAVTAAGSGTAVGLCSLWMLAPETTRRRVLSGLLAYSAGTLVAGSLLVLLPEAAARSTPLADAGYSRSRALRANAVSASAAVAGNGRRPAPPRERLSGLLPHVMALSAGGFLYIAVADLIPVLRRQPFRRGVVQTALILAGVATIAALEAMSP